MCGLRRGGAKVVVASCVGYSMSFSCGALDSRPIDAPAYQGRAREGQPNPPPFQIREAILASKKTLSVLAPHTCRAVQTNEQIESKRQWEVCETRHERRCFGSVVLPHGRVASVPWKTE